MDSLSILCKTQPKKTLSLSPQKYSYLLDLPEEQNEYGLNNQFPNLSKKQPSNGLNFFIVDEAIPYDSQAPTKIVYQKKSISNLKELLP